MSSLNLPEQRVKAEARLHKQYDFGKMSAADMEALPLPGGLLERAAWNDIRYTKTIKQKEIEQLEQANFIFDKFTAAKTDADKLKLLAELKSIGEVARG